MAQVSTGVGEADLPFVIVLGPPASGKSTLVREILAAHAAFRRFVVRHQLARERSNGTQLWESIKKSTEKGGWIPDALIIELFTRQLRAYPSARMVLQGLPANGAQAVMVRDLIEAHGVRTKLVLYLDASDSVCTMRMRHRMVCVTCDDGRAPASAAPGAPDRCVTCRGLLERRPDDNEPGFSQRLRTHRRNISGIFAAFQPEEITVLDATATPAAVAASARAALQALACR
ncbi:nucleoside monophosphate kinase [Nonomuraea diastatica]|uniref:Adenylate kinase n=1 Tax=Nonomuraea diastatica TaxID=1848329 RepID=A0A4R4WAE7_9ACTN|nr:nucleoside monophosphate kinase [Nonomuraea diastatica]TDD15101.1 nucleoside monophosphate kinase [Nonomuraea diastatica]